MKWEVEDITKREISWYHLHKHC